MKQTINKICKSWYQWQQNLIKKPKFFLDFTFLFIGYVASILPFFFIQKTFLYNYSVTLIFGILLFSNVVEKLIHPKIRVYIYIVAIILSLFGFQILSGGPFFFLCVPVTKKKKKKVFCQVFHIKLSQSYERPVPINNNFIPGSKIL